MKNIHLVLTTVLLLSSLAAQRTFASDFCSVLSQVQSVVLTNPLRVYAGEDEFVTLMKHEQLLDTFTEKAHHLSEASNPANIIPILFFPDEAAACFCAFDGDIKKVIGRICRFSAKEMTDPESRQDLEIVWDILMRIADDCLQMYRRWILDPILYLQKQTTPDAHLDQNDS